MGLRLPIARVAPSIVLRRGNLGGFWPSLRSSRVGTANGSANGHQSPGLVPQPEILKIPLMPAIKPLIWMIYPVLSTVDTLA